jgi:hypothetical protein
MDGRQLALMETGKASLVFALDVVTVIEEP